jgi:coniferyl-alcohol glucosyltransferase
MRKKIKKLKETAAESLSCDGGVAHESLSRIADESEHLLDLL